MNNLADGGKTGMNTEIRPDGGATMVMTHDGQVIARTVRNPITGKVDVELFGPAGA